MERLNNLGTNLSNWYDQMRNINDLEVITSKVELAISTTLENYLNQAI